MMTAVYPGSFDPITFGHLDLIERSAKMADRLIVGVLINKAKSPLFSIEERVKMIQDMTSQYGNVEVRAFEGLLVDFVKVCGADVIVRGLRAVTDFEYELQMSQTNKVMAPEVDTIFLTTNLKYSYVSSTMVKEIAGYGGDISAFLPREIAEKVEAKYRKTVK